MRKNRAQSDEGANSSLHIWVIYSITYFIITRIICYFNKPNPFKFYKYLKYNM